MRVPARRLAVILACAAGSPSCLALAATDEAAPGSNAVACGARAAVYWAGSGPKVQVLRRGRIRRDNPLAPPSETAPDLVIQVSINGRTATAYGPAFDRMRRGGPAQQLELESGHAIQWETALDGLPVTIRIVAEDGAEVVAALRFEQCAAPPGAKRETGPRSPKAPAKPRSAGEAARPLPQGAID